MKEYIEREAAIELGKKQSCAGIIDGGDFCNISANMLRKLPAADVVEVRHGRWILFDKTSGTAVCNQCNRQDNLDLLAKYCRYCGAKMEV